ncbi:YciI family protein [Haloechinothrix alba]|uniref:YciI family protein n=1 Tax=Haloechinothrix alba TaxID=664784 RepID=UPI0031841764
MGSFYGTKVTFGSHKLFLDPCLAMSIQREGGAWVFGGGLHPPDTATVVRATDTEARTTDGPYLEGKEHIGRFTVITAPDLDAALEWGRKLAQATTLPIEVRPLADGTCG